MNAEAYFSQYRVMRRRMGYHLRMSDRYREEAVRLPLTRWQAEKIAVLPSGDAPFIHPLEKAHEMEELLEEDVRIVNRLRPQMEAVIAALPAEEMRLVLRLYYMEYKSYSEIGELLLMDKSTAKRWQQRALAAAVLPEDPVEIGAEELFLKSATAATRA